MAAQRTCDVCGETKDLHGGKTCEKGHFVCKTCVGSSGMFSSAKTKCPIDDTKLK
jgi:hypothetical protein